VVDSIGTRIIFDGVWLNSVPTVVEGVSMAVSGVFDIQTISFNGKGICQANGNNLLMHVSQAGIPEKLKAGDIQAVSSSAFGSARNDAFIFDPNIIFKNAGSLGASYTFTRPGLTGVPVGVLPSPYEGFIVGVSESRVYYEYNRTAPVDVSFEGVEGFNLRRRLLPVCPKILKINTVDGCYNCARGSILSLSIVSEDLDSCSSGMVMATVDKDYVVLDTSSAKIYKTDPIDVMFSFRTSAEENDFNFCLHDDERVDCVRVEYTAYIDQTPLDPVLIEGVSFADPSDVDNGSLGDFLDFFNDPFSSMITVITAVFVLLLMYMACRLMPKFKKS